MAFLESTVLLQLDSFIMPGTPEHSSAAGEELALLCQLPACFRVSVALGVQLPILRQDPELIQSRILARSFLKTQALDPDSIMQQLQI